MFKMLAHHPVEGDEGGTWIVAKLGGQQLRAALHPCEVRIAFGTGARDGRALRLVGVDQLALLALEGQPGALDLDDFVEPFGFGLRVDAGSRKDMLRWLDCFGAFLRASIARA